MYKGYRFPREIIAHCVWLYHRFTLSFREIELMMAARGIEVSYETIRKWYAKFGPECARRLRRRAPQPGDKWHPGRSLPEDQPGAEVFVAGDRSARQPPRHPHPGQAKR